MGWNRIFLLVLVACSARCVPAADKFLLATGRVGDIVIGMSESEVYRVYPREIIRKVDLRLEGSPTPAVQVFLTADRKHPSLVIRFDGPVPGVYGVEVLDPRFRTAKGIGVGSTLGQLRRGETQLSLVSGEGVVGAAAKDLRMTFNLATYQTNRGMSLSRIPAATRIRSVWVHGK